MRRTTNGYFGGHDSTPTFRIQVRWMVIRYIQAFICLICLPFFAITANTRISFARNAPKLLSLKNGWGYILVLTCISIYILLSCLSFVFTCMNVVLSPVEGFGVDVFILLLWIISIVGVIVAHISFANSPAAKSEWLTISNTPKIGLWMTAICLLVCAATSIYTTRLSYLQFSTYRKSLRRTSVEATAALVPSAANTTSPPPSPPQTARPTSVSSSLWSRIRPLSSSSTTSRREQEEEPKPETPTGGLTREQIIAERVDAVRAPPTYWYATSNRPRDVGRVHDPEAGDETLPLYRP
ncbi:hypothetical protein TWF481_005474 [Arthrobotrys musiformis]|uniref:MARVEL domain-containing protein n=1 Tax=Arthrobotrys musiformis TaxID=47236 RepID=A0AAV9WEJ5_9PEZI